MKRQKKFNVANINLKSIFCKFSYIIVVLFLIILSHTILSPYNFSAILEHTKKKIIISGEVIFDNYKSGIIKIGAWRESLGIMHPPDVSRTRISKPGVFQLTVPKECGSIYIHAINIPKALPFWEKISAQNYPFGSYKNNPIQVKSSDIKGVLVNIEK